MRQILIAAAVLVWAAAAPAQPRSATPIADLQWLFIEDTVSLIQPPSAEADARARAAMNRAAAARAAGSNGEMRRHLAEARVVLAGGEWNAGAEFLHSLELRPNRVVIDPAAGFSAAIGQFYTARPPAGPLTLHLGFRRKGSAKTVWRERRVLADADLLVAPMLMSPGAGELTDGAYDLVLRAEIGTHELGQTTLEVSLVSGLDGKLADIDRRMKALKLAPPLAATLAWPRNLAQTLDARTRQAVATDWPALMRRTLALLADAEAGRDPLRQAKGESERHYFSAVSQRIEPYRLLVPPCWNGKAALPLVVLLHGSNGDHGRPFASGKAAELAQQHCWAVVAPMGYSPNGGWGNHLPVVLANGTMPAPRPSTIAGVVLPRDDVDPEPAEADVYDAIAAVRAAYPIDPRRIYLAGNSMGGEGVWHLAQRRPDLWAAAAPGAGAIAPAAYPYARLGKLPVLAVHGDKDDIISYAASAEMIERLNRAGGNGTLLTVPGGGHRSFEDVLDQVFAFFASHARRR